MKGEIRRVVAGVLGAVGAMFGDFDVDDVEAALTTNNWTFAGDGKWETGARWSAGAPVSTDSANLITNGTSKTVTIDATTTNAANVSALTISNLTMSAPSGQTNTLSLNFSGTNVPLRVLNSVLLNSNAAVVVSNSAVVANGSIVVGNTGANNRLSVTGGRLIVTNAVASAALEIRRGTFTFNDGMVTVDNLILTNGASSVMIFNGSSFSFNIGTLSSGATSVSNAQPFAVGNGTNYAAYHLLGGLHTFSDGMRIRSNSFLTGCGTINGTVAVDTNATVLADCGGTLTFTGSFTNNGAMRAINGTTLEAYDTLVNNGMITAIYGYTNFHGAFINNGTVVTSVTLGNGTATPDGSYVNAGNLTLNLFFTSVSLTSSNGIDIAEDVDLAHSEFGVSSFSLTLIARTINLTNDIVVGNGGLFLNAPTVNLDGIVTTTNGTLLATPRLLGTATNVNIFSDAANLQQAIDLASTNSVTVQVSPGQYQGDLTIRKQVTLLGDAGVTITAPSNVLVGAGDCAGGTNGVLMFSGGTLDVTGPLHIRRGSFILTNATLTVDKLVLTNSCATNAFPSGTLHSKETVITNGQQFVVGNGMSGANFHLLGGVHSFANGLRISNNATLTGCGTVNGTVVIDVGGTVMADCGTLTFTGTVTNNYAMAANNGSTLESSGTLVNNGAILLYNGGTYNFTGTFINNGVISNAGWVIVSSYTPSGDDEIIQSPSVLGFRYQLQVSPSLETPAWTNVGASQPGTGGVLTFTDPGGATNKPTRFYRVDVIAP